LIQNISYLSFYDVFCHFPYYFFCFNYWFLSSWLFWLWFFFSLRFWNEFLLRHKQS
jgi:hypothetical protein